MFDTHEPRTQHVLRAAAIEDEIRAHLVTIEQSLNSLDRASRYQAISTRLVPELRRLNDERFGSTRGISRHQDGMAAAAVVQDLDLCRQRVPAFADGPAATSVRGPSSDPFESTPFVARFDSSLREQKR